MSIALQISQLYSSNSSVNVNFTSYLTMQTAYVNLIDSLIMNPPVFEIGIDNQWMNVSSYINGVTKFLAALQMGQWNLIDAR